MVRLKALSDTMIRNTNDISIPYGAIKRSNKFRFTKLWYKISIPYGAIKSFVFSSNAYPFEDISIPYGAIKRILIKINTSN